MWLLIPALVLLYMSAVLSSFYALSLTKPKWQGPPLLMGKREMVFTGTHIVTSLTGITLLFIATGWKWGLIGLAIYWVFVVFVLMPAMFKLLHPDRLGLGLVIYWPLAIVQFLRPRK